MVTSDSSIYKTSKKLKYKILEQICYQIDYTNKKIIQKYLDFIIDDTEGVKDHIAMNINLDDVIKFLVIQKKEKSSL